MDMEIHNTNENLIKLRELTNKLCSSNDSEPNYQKIVFDISDLLNFSKNEMSNLKSKYEKLKCYEDMSNRLEIILKQIKFENVN